MTPRTPRFPLLHVLLLPLVLSVLLMPVRSDCANHFTEGIKAYWAGDFERAAGEFKELEQDKGKDYVLYLMNGATARISAGDFHHAERLLLAAKMTFEKELTDGEVAGQVLLADEKKTYVGHAYEQVLTQFFLGLCQYMQGDYENARIGFMEALEADTGSKEEYEGDVAYVHYMLGKTFMMLGRYDDAKVAMRNVAKHTDHAAIADLGLARAAGAQGRESECDDLMEEYASRDQCYPSGEARELGGYVTVVLLNGLSPKRGADAMTGCFTTIEKRSYPEKHARFYVDDELVGCSHVLTDLMHQGETSGGMGEQVASKAVGAVAREGLATVADALIPGGGCITKTVLGDDEADVRYWVTAPGDVQVCEVAMPPGLHTLRVEFFDAKDKKLERYEQVWYYIRADAEEPRTLVVRSLADIHNQTPKS